MTELVSVISALGVTGVALVGMVFHNNRVNDQKVSRVYNRMDEVKETFDKKYQSKEVCEVMQKAMRSDIQEIKSDIKLLLHKNGINNR